MLSWHQQIDGAKTISEVVSITRDYLATWSPYELGQLPKACRPGRIRDEADIDSLQENLVEEYRDPRASGYTVTLLQQLTGFLVRASLRMAELRAQSSEENPPAGSGKAAASREA